MSTNPPPAKRSKQSHDPSPIQISFTLPSSQQQRDDGTDNNDRLALEREKRQLDRERVRMEKEKHQMQKHNMDKQTHKMEQKIREATLQKLKVETALAKTSAAAAKFDVYKQLIKSGIATDKVESTYHAFEAIEDEEE